MKTPGQKSKTRRTIEHTIKILILIPMTLATLALAAQIFSNLLDMRIERSRKASIIYAGEGEPAYFQPGITPTETAALFKSPGRLLSRFEATIDEWTTETWAWNTPEGITTIIDYQGNRATAAFTTDIPAGDISHNALLTLRKQLAQLPKDQYHIPVLAAQSPNPLGPPPPPRHRPKTP